MNDPKNFWRKLNTPFSVLAPMDGVTDVVFREVLTLSARPDVFMTEFTNVEGINSKGRDECLKRLRFTGNQRPVVAQLWGLDPKNYFSAAGVVKDLGFDGVDINMGCPVHDVVRIGACSALMKNKNLAKEIVKACQEGAAGLPVSVKTRIGFDRIDTENWIGFLLKLNLSALIVHGRTVSEMSKVSAHWDEIAKSVDLKNKINPETVIIGNGDVKSWSEATEKSSEFEVDGIMIGRGVLTNPWVFEKDLDASLRDDLLIGDESHSIQDRFDLLIAHLELFKKEYGVSRNFDELKKYFKIYISGFENASELREQFMQLKDIDLALERVRTVRNPGNSDLA